jgi:hypothetical protein
MSDGPIACQIGGGAAGAAALTLRRVVRGLRLGIVVSATAALAIAAAKDFAARAALRARIALAALAGFARIRPSLLVRTSARGFWYGDRRDDVNR